MIKNIFWDFTGRFGYMAVTFLVSLVLTRLLSPSEYGIMGMAMVIIGIGVIFYDLGFSKAIVQAKEINKVQLSTIFYINVVLSFSLTLACYFLAEPLAQFYDQPLIKPVFRVLSFSFVLNALNLIPSSMLYREMRFKALSVFNLVAISVSGLTGIIMAFNGYGVWSLVAQTLGYSFILILLYYGYYRWLPGLVYKWKTVVPLWRYGSRLLITSFLELSFSRLDSFIIGKIFSVAMLGYYSRAQTMEGMVRQFSINSFMTVLFPVIAKNQHDREYLTNIYSRYLHIICFISFGISGVLFLTAKPLFIVLFSEKWAYAGVLFQLMAALIFIYPLNAIMCNFITGVGNSKSYLRLEMFKKFVLIPVYLFGFLRGLEWFIIVFTLANFFNLIIAVFYLRNEIKFGFLAHLNYVLPYLLVCIFSCGLTFFILRWFDFNVYITLILNGMFFTITYLMFAHILPLKGKNISWDIIQPRLLSIYERKFV